MICRVNVSMLHAWETVLKYVTSTGTGAQHHWQRSSSSHGKGSSMANTKPVIIAGAGPTGLVLGLELARYGEFIMPGRGMELPAPRLLPALEGALLTNLNPAAQPGIASVIVERNFEPTMHPQAHFINNRTMEVRGPMKTTCVRCLHTANGRTWLTTRLSNIISTDQAGVQTHDRAGRRGAVAEPPSGGVAQVCVLQEYVRSAPRPGGPL